MEDREDGRQAKNTRHGDSRCGNQVRGGQGTEGRGDAGQERKPLGVGQGHSGHPEAGAMATVNLLPSVFESCQESGLFKFSPHTEQELCEWWVLTNLTLVTMLQYKHLSNHHIVHLKLKLA